MLIFFVVIVQRINPGDKTKSVSDIIKITSGSNHEIAEIIETKFIQNYNCRNI